MAQNLDDFGFGYVLSKYPGVIIIPAELIPSQHGAPHRLGGNSIHSDKKVPSRIDRYAYGTLINVHRYIYHGVYAFRAKY